MDIVLKFYDEHIFTPFVYPVSWKEDYFIRQLFSLFLIVSTHSILMYLTISGLVYYFVFDKEIMKHPKYLKV